MILNQGRMLTMSDKLAELVESIRGYKMTPEEVSEQRVSFVYGNAPQRDNSTKEQVRQAVNSTSGPAD